MVTNQLSDDDVDRLFQALADTTRRDILNRVLRREQSVSALAAAYAMSFAAVHKHVSVLERARLVTKERRGREQLVHPVPGALRTAARLLDEYESVWRDRASRIDELIADD